MTDEKMSAPTGSQEAAQPNSVVVKISKLQSCSCNQWSGSGHHFSVEQVFAELGTVQACAVSYCWGEFDRFDHHFGHLAEDPATSLHINLGVEWSWTEYISRLVDLTNEYGGCWIDQLCIPQKDEEIRKTLAAIPLIYKTLPVVTLLPGSLCKCLSQAMEMLGAAHAVREKARRHKEEVSEEWATVDDELLQEAEIIYKEADDDLFRALRGMDCLASNGSCSWFDRIWTSQELRYARTIRVVFANKDSAPCFYTSGDHGDWQDKLQGCVYWAYSHLEKQGLGPEQIVQKLKYRHSNFFLKLKDAMRDQALDDVIPFQFLADWQGLDESIARLFLGESGKLDREYLEYRSFYAHSQFLRGLSTQRLTATKSNDYVLSVWVDLLEYTIPKDAKEQTVWELLADAFQQCPHIDPLQQLYHIPTFWPAGLFGATNNTGCWLPEYYQPKREARDCRDVYGPFRWNCHIKIEKGGNLPLHISSDGSDPRMKLLSFADIASKFGDSLLEHLNTSLRYIDPREENLWEHDKGEYNILPADDEDPELSVLNLLCDLLFIDIRVCREKNIQPMFVWRDLEKGIDEELLSGTRLLNVGLINQNALNDAMLKDNRCVSVSDMRFDKIPLYEAVQIGREEYAVIGIWAPLHTEAECLHIEAEMTHVDSNAWLI